MKPKLPNGNIKAQMNFLLGEFFELKNEVIGMKKAYENSLWVIKWVLIPIMIAGIGLIGLK